MLLRWIETRPVSVSFPFFLCNQAPTTEIYTLSLHDALPIYTSYMHTLAQRGLTNNDNSGTSFYVVLSSTRSEEHTSELQSPYDLVCRLLLEKKKNDLQDTSPPRKTARLRHS